MCELFTNKEKERSRKKVEGKKWELLIIYEWDEM